MSTFAAALLQAAMSLLLLVQGNPNIDTASRDQAIMVANQAIKVATAELGIPSQSVESVKPVYISPVTKPPITNSGAVAITYPTTGSTLIPGTKNRIKWDLQSKIAFDEYQVVVGNSISNITKEIAVLKNSQNELIWPVSESILRDYAGTAKYSYDVIKDSFYIKINLVKNDSAGGGVVGSSRELKFSIGTGSNSIKPVSVDLKYDGVYDGPITRAPGSGFLSWTSVNADYCTASGDVTNWSGTKALNGSEKIWFGNEKYGKTDYKLTCGKTRTDVDTVPVSDVVTVNFASTPYVKSVNGGKSLVPGKEFEVRGEKFILKGGLTSIYLNGNEIDYNSSYSDPNGVDYVIKLTAPYLRTGEYDLWAVTAGTLKSNVVKVKIGYDTDLSKPNIESTSFSQKESHFEIYGTNLGFVVALEYSANCCKPVYGLLEVDTRKSGTYANFKLDTYLGNVEISGLSVRAIDSKGNKSDWVEVKIN